MAEDKVKRKSRNKLAKIIDVTVPVSIEKLGSNEDPCFGKHYDPREETCGRCGDSEICAIVMGQLNHLKRAEIEMKQEFLDTKEHTSTLTPKEIRKSIKNRIREMVKMGGEKGVPIDNVIEDIHASYSMDGYSRKKIGKVIDKQLDLTTKFHKSKSNLVWNSSR